LPPWHACTLAGRDHVSLAKWIIDFEVLIKQTNSWFTPAPRKRPKFFMNWSIQQHIFALIQLIATVEFHQELEQKSFTSKKEVMKNQPESQNPIWKLGTQMVLWHQWLTRASFFLLILVGPSTFETYRRRQFKCHVAHVAPLGSVFKTWTSFNSSEKSKAADNQNNSS